MLENIDRLPREANAHWLWGDYIELCCINTPDKLITASDIYDIILEGEDSNIDGEEFQEKSPAARNDSIMERVLERFSYLGTRSSIFLEHYPFDIDLQKNQLSLKTDFDENSFNAYIFLLLSAGLRYHNRSEYSSLTTTFELVSVSTLVELLNKNAEVHLFSSKNTSIPSTAFGKISWLSTQLNASVIAKEVEFSGNTAGEAGLDAIAWHNLGDRLSNRPLYLVQCACSPKDWVHKVSESSYSRWNKILALSTPPMNLMFIPHSYRGMDHDWLKHYNLGDAILFDRRRILEFFSDTEILQIIPRIEESLREFAIQ